MDKGNGKFVEHGIFTGSHIKDNQLYVFVGKELTYCKRVRWDENAYGYEESDSGYSMTPPSTNDPIFYNDIELVYSYY